MPNPYTAVVDGSGNEWIHHMVADDAGNLYLAGAYTSAAVNGLARIVSSTTLDLAQLAAATGVSDAFVAKLDHTGKLIWVARSSGAEEEAATGLGYDRTTDTLIVSGYFSGTNVVFGSVQASPHDSVVGVVSAGLVNLFVAAIDPEDGTWLSVEPMPLQVKLGNGTAPATDFGGVEIRTGEYLPVGAGGAPPKKQFMGRSLALGPEDITYGTAVYLKGMFNTTALTGPLAAGSSQNVGQIQMGAGEFRDITVWDRSGIADDSGEWSFIVRVNIKKEALGAITWDWKWNAPINAHPNSETTDAVTSLLVSDEGDRVYLSGYWRGLLGGPDGHDYATPDGVENGFVGALNSSNGSTRYIAAVGGASAIHSLSLERPDPEDSINTPKLVAVGGVAASGTNAEAGQVELVVINTLGAGSSQVIEVPGWPSGISAHDPKFTERPFVGRLDAQEGTWLQSGLLVNDQQEVLLGALHDVEVSRSGLIYLSGFNWANDNFDSSNNAQPLVAQPFPSDSWANDRISMQWHQQSAAQHTNPQLLYLYDALIAAWSFEQPDLGDRGLLSDNYRLLQHILDDLGFATLNILDPAPGEGILGQSLSYANSYRIPPRMTGHAHTPAGPLVDTNGSFTVSGWVKLPSDMSNGNGTFFSQDSAPTQGLYYGERFIFRVSATLGGKFTFTLQDISVSSTTDSVANTWYHIAIVKDADPRIIRIYVNGVEEGSVQYSSGLDFTSTGYFRIGYYAANSNLLTGFFDGDIDEVQVFDTALNNEQINTVFQTIRLIKEPANYMVHELALNSLQTLYSSAATGAAPLVQGSDPKWKVGLPVTGSIDSVAGSIDSDSDGLIDRFDLYPEDPTRGAGIWREQFDAIGRGKEIADLINASKFPENPDVVEQLDLFEGPTNFAENYGTRIHGIFIAPESGFYNFWVAGDNSVQLSLSSNASPAKKVVIASAPFWTTPREWGKYPEQQSADIFLVAGQPYYLEVLHKEELHADSLAVAWQRPSNSSIEVIDAKYFRDLQSFEPDGSPSFEQRLSLLSSHGAVISAHVPENGGILTEFLNYQEYVVGQLLDRPVGALLPGFAEDKRQTFADGITNRLDFPANINAGEPQLQTLYASQFDQEWYAAAPIGEARLLWPTTNDLIVQNPPREGRAIRIRWPTLAEGLQEYVYGNPATSDIIPDVVLNPDDANDSFFGLLWSEDLNGQSTISNPTFATDTVSGAQTLATSANGYSTLLFHDGISPDTSVPRIQSVRAYRWDEKTTAEPAVVGQEVIPPADSMSGKTGYPMRPLSKHDTDPLVYDPTSRRGQIVPVNLDRNPSTVEDDDLRIAWYKEDSSLRDWPFRTVTYDLSWPSGEQVVIASELCSTGVNSNGEAQLPLSRPDGTLTDIQLYVQNDPLQPGFNPNDEHGLLTQVSGTPAACALRTDIGVPARGACDNNPGACYTSDPYLIVKSVDTTIDDISHATLPWVYRVFQVKLYDPTHYPSFDLAAGEAGNGLQPPFPLYLPGFSSPSTIGAGQPFWVDVNGQVWARAAGDLTAQYFYPATAGSGDFYLDSDGDGHNDAGSAGDIPWLAGIDDPATDSTDESNNGQPLALTYNISWPAVVPELEIGDTLTDQRPNGLPAVRNMKTVDVIFDERDAWDPAQPGAQSTPSRHQDANLRVFDFSVPIGQPPCAGPDYEDYVEGSYCDEVVPTNSGDAVVIGTGGTPPTLPARIYLDNGQWFFPTLPSHLRYRMFFDPTRGTQDDAGNVSGEFTFRGGDFDGETGRPYAGIGSKLTLINIMNASERDTLKLLDNDDGFTNDEDDNPGSAWDAIVDALYLKSRNPGRLDLDQDDTPDPDILAGFEVDTLATVVETQHQQGTGESALTAAFAQQGGYITIAENNIVDGSGDPVNVHIMKIVEPRARGALRVIRNADNQLDERLVVRHDLDFGGRDGMVFEWWWRPDNGSGIPSVNLSDGCAQPGPGTAGCPDPADGWLLLGETSDNSYTLRTGLEVVADGWMLARYKGLPAQTDPNGEDWLGYAGQSGIAPTEMRPVATAGWVKRVLEGVNAFEQRYDDLNQNAPVTYSGLLVQAGRPYGGDVALNNDDGNLNQVGLMELYQTVSNRARALTIDAVDPITEQEAVNKQLLLVSNRLAEFSMILGDEAFSDAQDPTVGTAEVGGSATYLSPSLFAFQNQVPTLLDEELALLRGRRFDNQATDPYPVYNRLPWNFSSGSGEPVYVQVYGITDQAEPLGAVDDAQRVFPQGHGDALGYYLDATKQYYRLALHPNYDWKPLTETTTIGGIAVEVDYADEETFARAAARKARTNARVLDLTYRQNYTHDPAGQWSGYPDTDPNRRWGVDGWTRRGAQGAYLDYALANALLKHEDTDHTGLQKIDRVTVRGEVGEIAAAFAEIVSLANLVDSGRNPLGLSADAVPFDISPTDLDQGETHFDQVYSRAVKASVNALQVFNYANDLTQAIRTQQLSQGDLQAKVDAREQEFKHRLIELFGYPYAGDMGPNATYPPDYTGADLYHFMYLNATTIDGDDAQGLLPPTQIDKAIFTPSFDPDTDSIGADTSGVGRDLVPRDVLNDPNTTAGYDRWFDVDPDSLVEIPYPYATAGDYAFTAPADWGKRRAPGKIQLALLDMVRLQARLQTAIAKHSATVDTAGAQLEILEALHDVDADLLEARNKIIGTFSSTQAIYLSMKNAATRFNIRGEALYRVRDVVSTGCTANSDNAITVGMDMEVPNFINCVKALPRTNFILANMGISQGLNLAQTPFEYAASVASLTGRINFNTLSFPIKIANQLKAIEAEFNKELELRYQVAEIGQELEIAAGNYEALVAQGLRVLEERVTHRRNIARITTDARYQDYVYRVFRNDALQKYLASFDLAVRYTYLAAKAFDYETGLLANDPANGTFLDSIIKQRSLGQFTVSTSNIGNSTPLANVEGLSDPLAKMKQTYDALSANFDNVYDQNVRFSLRQEMLRIPGAKYSVGAEYDDVWQQALTEALVPDLWAVPEFRQYAVPSRPESAGPLPGLVLRFSTEINDGKNLFGWPLAGGDAAYSSTYSATKFRRVGVDMVGYDGNTLLSATPYVYLLPVGLDVLRSPTEIGRKREYTVVEQAIPVPVDLVNFSGFEQAGWIPLIDGISSADSWDAMRKHPQLQAGWGASSGQLQPLGNTRLVGRSVWNTEWLLIIPGSALLADEQEGLRRLVRGDGSGNGISDIELFFESFSVQ